VVADTGVDAFGVRSRNGAECPSKIEDLPQGSTIRAFALNTGDTSLNDAGLDGFFDNVVLETTTKVTTFDFEPAEEEKVSICHATNGPNSFVVQEVSVNSILNGNGGHGQSGVNANDIIPAIGTDFAGQNLATLYGSATGIDVLANGCEVPALIIVSAAKIVCDYESELPNWAKGNNNAPTNVTITTATDWLAANTDTTCRLVDDWEFQWSDRSVSVPNRYNTFLGEATRWNTFTLSLIHISEPTRPY